MKDFGKFGTYNNFKYAEWYRAYKNGYWPLPLFPDYETKVFERDFFAL